MADKQVWENFYSETKQPNQEEDFVDQISIDVINKVYVLYEHIDDAVIGGEDEEGNEISLFYVSREVFDVILEGLKSKGYKEVRKRG